MASTLTAPTAQSGRPSRASGSGGVRRRTVAPIPEIVGESKAIRDLRTTINLVASDECAVVIYGESGTGKELVARALHRLSKRGDRPFVAINSAGLADSMLESELFGHERGAFTGAARSHRGIFEQAAGGTVFLDEVGDMPPSLQVKLLRVLQEREIVRIGSDSASRPIRVDVRIIAATHKDLAEEVAAGRFREDLYWRLTGFEIEVPALRDRERDAVLIAKHLLTKRRARFVLARDAQRLLRGYGWPGNVRELQNVIGRACVTARGRRIRACDLHLRGPLTEPHRRTGNERRQQILTLLAQGEPVSPRDIQQGLRISKTSWHRDRQRLERDGLIRRVGEGSGSRYVLAQQANEDHAELNRRQRTGLRLLSELGRITRQQYVDATQASVRTASRDLSDLVKKGLMVPDGRPGKAGGYVAA